MERIRRSVVWGVFAVLLVGFTVSTQAIEIFKEAEDAYTNTPGWTIAPSGFIAESGSWKEQPQWTGVYGTLGSISPAVGDAVSWNINVPSAGVYLVQLGVENDGNRGNLDVYVDGDFVGEIVVRNLQHIDDPAISGIAFSVLRPFVFSSPTSIGMMRTAVGAAGVVEMTAGVHNVKVVVIGPEPYAFIDYIRLTSVDDAYDLGFADGETAHVNDYTNGYNAGRSDVLNILPPGIRKNVEAQQGFAK